MCDLIVKEEEKAVPSVSIKRTATSPASGVLGKVVPFESTSKKYIVSPQIAAVKAVKAATVLRIGKAVGFYSFQLFTFYNITKTIF
jgi:hypothetical protein